MKKLTKLRKQQQLLWKKVCYFLLIDVRYFPDGLNIESSFSIRNGAQFSPHPSEAVVSGERACVTTMWPGYDSGLDTICGLICWFSLLLWEVFPWELQFSPGNYSFPLGTAVFPWELQFSLLPKYHQLITVSAIVLSSRVFAFGSIITFPLKLKNLWFPWKIRSPFPNVDSLISETKSLHLTK